jgi:hypothetical protein
MHDVQFVTLILPEARQESLDGVFDGSVIDCFLDVDEEMGF